MCAPFVPLSTLLTNNLMDSPTLNFSSPIICLRGKKTLVLPMLMVNPRSSAFSTLPVIIVPILSLKFSNKTSFSASASFCFKMLFTLIAIAFVNSSGEDGIINSSPALYFLPSFKALASSTLISKKSSSTSLTTFLIWYMSIIPFSASIVTRTQSSSSVAPICFL